MVSLLALIEVVPFYFKVGRCTSSGYRINPSRPILIYVKPCPAATHVRRNEFCPTNLCEVCFGSFFHRQDATSRTVGQPLRADIRRRPAGLLDQRARASRGADQTTAAAGSPERGALSRPARQLAPRIAREIAAVAASQIASAPAGRAAILQRPAIGLN